MDYILYDHKELSGVFLDPSDNRWHAFMFKRCSHGWYVSLMQHPSWNTFYRPVLGDMYCSETAQEELLREGKIRSANKAFISDKSDLPWFISFMNRKYREMTGDMQSPKPDVRMAFDPANDSGIYIDSIYQAHHLYAMTYFETDCHGNTKLHRGFSLIQINGASMSSITDSLIPKEMTDCHDRKEGLKNIHEQRKAMFESAGVRTMEHPNLVIVATEDIPKLIDFLNEKLQEKWNRN